MTQQITESSNLERKLASADIEIEPVEQGRSIVVVIGINEYAHWRKLNNAVHDACGLQQTLIDKLGFIAPIEPLIDGAATKDAIEALVTEQLREVVKKDDNLVLFFAGHGHTRVEELSETGFIIPVNARIPDTREYWGDYIRLNHWLQEVSELPARHILVILDACHSGFALGGAMNVFRDAVRYQKDINRNRSRKVITSAKRDQPALDSGPIPGHSLFTGTIINGFNWGEADIDGNGFITSSELGLYLQQKVGQASESQQTPEFGSFLLDDQGEMVISLRNQSFDSLKARAFSALQQGKISTFEELTQEVCTLRPLSPECLYLEYRLRLSRFDIKEAIETIKKLSSLNFTEGTIPIAKSHVRKLKNLLSYWKPLLEIRDSKLSLDIVFFNGKSQESLKPVKAEVIEEREECFIGHNSVFQFSLKNNTQSLLYIYTIQVYSSGLIDPITLLNPSIALDGLSPGKLEYSYPFIFEEMTGLREICFFVSPRKLNWFIAPPQADTKPLLPPIKDDDLIGIQRKSIFYRSLNSPADPYSFSLHN